MISIAIDGPSGAGKSSLSRRLAAELGYIYVDTGAMYRTIGLHVLRSGADTEDEDAVAALLPGIRLEMRYVDGVQHMFLNGEDVSGLIRTEEVSMAASHVSAHPSVRAFLLDAQRALAKDNNVLMDGRDIGTVVLPGAQVKIFLTASAGDRARRRYDELIARGEWVSYEQVLAEYRSSSLDGMADSEGKLVTVPRRDVLDLVEDLMMPRGKVLSVEILDDTADVEMSDMRLDQISEMFAVMEEQPIVQSVELNVASTEENRAASILSFSVRIYLRPETEVAE